MSFTLTEEEKGILIRTAREAIAARLVQRAPRYPEPTNALRARCGAFVTLKKGGALRGCIGHISASKPLADTVKEVAVSSAFEDPRFPPIGSEEWGGVRIEISVLSPFQKITDVNRIEVGVHGIMMKRGFRSGLLLPQVAAEQGWNRDTFLTHTCYKAGLPGDAWKTGDVAIEIFSALVFGEPE
jgi:AmmeMemoRadiSam system protein A